MPTLVIRLLPRLALVGIGLAQSATAVAAEPLAGSWQADLARSSFSPGPAPKALTRTYRDTPEGVLMTVTTVAAEGRTSEARALFRADGRDYPVEGAEQYDSLAVKRVDAQTVEVLLKRAGTPIGAARRTLSADGRTLTIDTHGTTAHGTPFHTLVVYQRD